VHSGAELHRTAIAVTLNQIVKIRRFIVVPPHLLYGLASPCDRPCHYLTPSFRQYLEWAARVAPTHMQTRETLLPSLPPGALKTTDDPSLGLEHKRVSHLEQAMSTRIAREVRIPQGGSLEPGRRRFRCPEGEGRLEGFPQ